MFLLSYHCGYLAQNKIARSPSMVGCTTATGPMEKKGNFHSRPERGRESGSPACESISPTEKEWYKAASSADNRVHCLFLVVWWMTKVIG